MSELRIVLLVVGVLVVIGIIGWEFHRRRQGGAGAVWLTRLVGFVRRKPQRPVVEATRPARIVEPTLGSLDSLDSTSTPTELLAPDASHVDPADVDRPAAELDADLLASASVERETLDATSSGSDPDLLPESSAESSAATLAGEALDDAPELARPNAPGQLDLEGLDVDPSPERGQSNASLGAGRPGGDDRSPMLPTGGGPELVIVFTLMAKAGGTFGGAALRDAFDQFGIHHGAMNLYHHFGGGSAGQAPPMFSVANVIEPGTFEAGDLSEFSTPGLCLFLRLPGPLDGVLAFELMVDIANKLARALDGELRDANRSSLTGQGAQQMREQVVEFCARHRSGDDYDRVLA